VETHGSPAFQESFSVVANASSSEGGRVADHLVFKIMKRQGVK
jgi:hypothetical protein